jgi:hypothetical protein
LLGERSQVSVIKRTEEDSANLRSGEIACFGRPVALNSDMLMVVVIVGKWYPRGPREA